MSYSERLELSVSEFGNFRVILHALTLTGLACKAGHNPSRSTKPRTRFEIGDCLSKTPDKKVDLNSWLVIPALRGFANGLQQTNVYFGPLEYLRGHGGGPFENVFLLNN